MTFAYQQDLRRGVQPSSSELRSALFASASRPQDSWSRDTDILTPSDEAFVRSRGEQIRAQRMREQVGGGRNRLELEAQGRAGEAMTVALLEGIRVNGKLVVRGISAGIEGVFRTHLIDDYFKKTDVGVIFADPLNEDIARVVGIDVATGGNDLLEKKAEDLFAQRLLARGEEARRIYLPNDLANEDRRVADAVVVEGNGGPVLKAAQSPLIAAMPPDFLYSEQLTISELVQAKQVFALQLGIQARILGKHCLDHAAQGRIDFSGLTAQQILEDFMELQQAVRSSVRGVSVSNALGLAYTYLAFALDIQDSLSGDKAATTAINHVDQNGRVIDFGLLQEAARSSFGSTEAVRALITRSFVLVRAIQERCSI